MKKYMRDLICYFARPIASKNVFGLLLLPSIGLGFLWGFAFIKIRHVTQSDQFLGFLGTFNAEPLAVFLGVVPFVLVSFFAIYPIARGIQLLMPETFDDSDYEELDD